MVSEIKMDELREKAVGAFTGGYMCSETLVYILNKYYDLGISEEAIAMSTGFPFGFGDGKSIRPDRPGRSEVSEMLQPGSGIER